MTPITHAVIDEDGDVLSTHGLYTHAVENAVGRAGHASVVSLYDISCFDLLEAVLWNGHKQVWEVRARGSNTYHRSRLLREAVGLAVASVVHVAAAPVVEEEALW